MVKAVIDVGSNSVLSLVATNAEGPWEALSDRAWVTALGENTKTTGRLGETGIAATLKALLEAYTEAEKLGAKQRIALATMAARIADNRNDFLGRARGQGTPVHVLSGEAEARLGFLAVAQDPLFADLTTLSIIDVGGHSTELVTAEMQEGEWRNLLRHSFPIGTLGLRETLLGEESPGPEAILAACRAIDDSIGLCYMPGCAGVTVSLGATGTNLVSIRNKTVTWDPFSVHGATLDYEEVSRAVGHLFGMSETERSAIMGIEPGREKTLHIGALILERFLFAIKAETCRVSARGWRYALLDEDPSPDDMEKS